MPKISAHEETINARKECPTLFFFGARVFHCCFGCGAPDITGGILLGGSQRSGPTPTSPAREKRSASATMPLWTCACSTPPKGGSTPARSPVPAVCDLCSGGNAACVSVHHFTGRSPPSDAPPAIGTPFGAVDRNPGNRVAVTPIYAPASTPVPLCNGQMGG